MTTPEIQKDLENIVNKYQVLSNAINNDGKIDDKEQFDINTSLKNMKDDILKLAKNPEDLKNYITELNILVEKKGIPKHQIEELFAKEVSEYKTQIVDISKLPQVEQNNFNTDITQAYINKKEDCETCEQDTKKELNTLAGLTVEQYKYKLSDTISETRKKLRLTKRGEGREVRKTVRYINERLDNTEFRIKKFDKFDKKFGAEDLNAKHIQAMLMKINTLLTNSNDYISQGITGDLNEAKRFFPPNFFDDKSYYIPDVLPSENIVAKQVGKIDTKGINLNTQDQQLVDQYNTACESGSTNSGMKAIGNLIDTKMAPWLDANVTNGKGTKVLTGAAKLGLLVANGVMIWNIGKSIRGLVFDKDKEKAFKRLLISGGIFTALNFVDPEKALAKGKELRGWVSGDTSKEGGSKNGDIDMSSAITAINSKDTSPEKKIQVYGSTVIGNGLAGITYAEAATHSIFACSGNKITNINTEALKEFYKTKYETKPEYRNTIIQYVNAIETIQSKNPDLIKDVMNYHAITMSDLSKQTLSGTLMATHILDKLSKAKELEGIYGATTIDATLKQQDPKISETLGATQFDELVEGINKLSPEVKQQFIDKKIQFKTKEGQLYMQANGEEVKLNINNHTHALANKSGQFIEFPDGAKDVEELLQVTYNMTESIHENKGKFMVDKPLFYNKDLGERGHTICATIGPREIDKPMSWVSGQYVKIFDAQRPLFGLLGDQHLEKFEDENVLARYTKYLNDLGIWKGETSQDFIDNDIKTKIAREHPNLSPTDQQKILENYLGLYNTRGDLGATLFEGGVWAKDKAYQITSDMYTFTKEKLGQGRDKLSTAAESVYNRTVRKGELILFVKGKDGIKEFRLRKWLEQFYPTDTINALKAKYEEACQNNFGLIGDGIDKAKANSNRLISNLLGFQLFGESKKKPGTQEQENTSEQNEVQGQAWYGISKKIIPNDDFYSYLNDHSKGKEYIQYMTQLSESKLEYNNDVFMRVLANGGKMSVENDVINNISQLAVIKDYQKAKKISPQNSINGVKNNIKIREREYRPLSKKAGYRIHGAAESVVSFGGDIVKGIRNGGTDAHGNLVPPPTPPEGTPIGERVGSGIRTGFGWIWDGAKRTVSQGGNVVKGGAENAFDGDKDNAKDIK